MVIMKKSKFTETQIVKPINEHEAGRKTEDICRERAISAATFCKWHQRYGWMEANEVKELEDLPGVGGARLKSDVYRPQFGARSLSLISLQKRSSA